MIPSLLTANQQVSEYKRNPDVVQGTLILILYWCMTTAVSVSFSGDPEMVPLYVKSLLPIFCQSFQSTMIHSVKKSSLGLIKKMIHYMSNDLMASVCKENKSLVGAVVEVLTAVLDHEEDEEGHLTCLLIIQDLMSKDPNGLFLEQFAKLGLYSKVKTQDV